MSVVGYGPLWRIDGPLPIPPQFGLLQAAAAPAAGVQIVPDADGQGVERWINGVEVFPYPADTASTFDTCAPSSEAENKAAGGDAGRPQFGAFTVYLPEQCTAYRVWNQDEFKARAVAAFAAVEGAAIAAEFLTGARMLLNPHLADGQGTFPNGDTACNPVKALGLLEGEIAKSGRAGLIHCTPMMVEALADHYDVDQRNGVIRTMNGTVVIPDFGYVNGATPATSGAWAAGHPVAAGTDQEWMYASGPVEIRRSEIFVMPDNVIQALDRETNEITYRAERYVLVTWDTAVQAAVLADRCLTACDPT